MKKELIAYLPPVLQEILEFQLITKAEQPEVNRLRETLQGVYENQFYDLARQDGIARYEEILNVTPGFGDSLELRRLRVKSKMTMQLPYTMRVLRLKLEQLFGPDQFDLILHNEIYELAIYSDLTDSGKRKLLKQLLKEMVPCNLWIVYGMQAGSLVIVIPAQMEAVAGIQMPFSARRPVPRSFLDGAFFLDGNRLLNGLSGVFSDYYPVKASVTMSARTMAQMTAKAVVEKDYHTLDGSIYLDGAHCLAASRVEMEV